MFIDHAKIYVKAGNGGNGALSFRTEKYVPDGGPDGGDGGDGGNVVFVAASKLTTLQSFRFKHKFVADDGAKGMGRKMYGRGGADLRIAVPVGTIIRDASTNKILVDFSQDGQEYIAVKGGKGGAGTSIADGWDSRPERRRCPCHGHAAENERPGGDIRNWSGFGRAGDQSAILGAGRGLRLPDETGDSHDYSPRSGNS